MRDTQWRILQDTHCGRRGGHRRGCRSSRGRGSSGTCGRRHGLWSAGCRRRHRRRCLLIRLGVQCTVEEGAGAGKRSGGGAHGQPRSRASKITRSTGIHRRVLPSVVWRRPRVDTNRCDLPHAIRVNLIRNLKHLQHLDATSIPLALECRDELQDADDPRQRWHVKR